MITPFVLRRTYSYSIAIVWNNRHHSIQLSVFVAHERSSICECVCSTQPSCLAVIFCWPHIFDDYDDENDNNNNLTTQNKTNWPYVLYIYSRWYCYWNPFPWIFSKFFLSFVQIADISFTTRVLFGLIRSLCRCGCRQMAAAVTNAHNRTKCKCEESVKNNIAPSIRLATSRMVERKPYNFT